MKNIFITLLLAGAITTIYAQPKPAEKTNPQLPEMVFVEGGGFRMGSNSPLGDESPIHRVTVSSFEIGKYEVTVAQFRKFITATGYKTTADKKGGGNVWGGASAVYKAGVNWEYSPLGNKVPPGDNDHPVVFITWDDAVSYCQWLSKETGKTYRLPSEAEWEFAAYGGTKGKETIYAGSKDIASVAWYKGNCLGQDVHPVGKKKPNELGIYDMTGNAAEWCNDFYAGDYFAESPSVDPLGPATGKYRVVHGGDAWDDKDPCRISHRFSYYDSDYVLPTMGFRVACSVKQQ